MTMLWFLVGSTVGYLARIVVLPLIGTAIYRARPFYGTSL
jgi:hypothetical protein